MSLFSIIIVMASLCLLGVICNINNIIINAETLSIMGAKARCWF